MKLLQITPQNLKKIKDSILADLDKLTVKDTNFNANYDFNSILKEELATGLKTPIVYMAAPTYLKMMHYVNACSVEIAWHGTVERGTGDKSNQFFIKDVYLYPQLIASATVKTDDDAYTKWSDEQSDEDFNNRRFQGHSHVNMATIYSGVDLANQQKFLQDLLPDDYYIFLVTNKSKQHNFVIYDLKNNVLFENEDIDFRVYVDNKHTLKDVEDDIENYCKKETYAPTNLIKTTKYSGNYFQDIYGDYFKKKKSKTTVNVKRDVVLLNRTGRNFEKEYPEYEGDVLDYISNGKTQKMFVPFVPFETYDVALLKRNGWHIKAMDVPEEYDEI